MHVRGIGRDQNGEPLIGVSVVPSEALRQGIITNVDGQYGVTVKGSTTLKFSYVGFKTQSVTVKPGGTYDITMQENNDMNDINPTDIEAMEILKETSATAIYGSRGANSIVIITTKKVMQGRHNINSHANTGIQMRSLLIDTISGQDFIDYINAANTAQVGTSPFPNDFCGVFKYSYPRGEDIRKIWRVDQNIRSVLRKQHFCLETTKISFYGLYSFMPYHLQDNYFLIYQLYIFFIAFYYTY